MGGAERNLIQIEIRAIVCEPSGGKLGSSRTFLERQLNTFRPIINPKARQQLSDSSFFLRFLPITSLFPLLLLPPHIYMMSFGSTITDSYLVRCLQTAPCWQACVVVFFLVTGALYSTVSLLSCVRALLSIFVLPGKSVL
jgi:hypothetical protein